jgi:ComF family protein
VPVPASAEKLKERGFNQAELLASRLAALLGAPVLPQALLRRDSLAQHTLNRKTRLQNAETAYAINEATHVKGKHILLVDDVLTTGATMASCGALLLEAGAASVVAVAATATK